jgi:hypothetical protein
VPVPVPIPFGPSVLFCNNSPLRLFQLTYAYDDSHLFTIPHNSNPLTTLRLVVVTPAHAFVTSLPG